MQHLNIAHICVEDNGVKARVDQMGEIVPWDTLDALNLEAVIAEIPYTPVIFCNEGSPLDVQLRENPKRDGHVYSVRKVVDLPQV